MNLKISIPDEEMHFCYIHMCKYISLINSDDYFDVIHATYYSLRSGQRGGVKKLVHRSVSIIF